MTESPLLTENKKLRRKLKQLSTKFEDQVQKNQQAKHNPPTPQPHKLQLENAYKIIDRLQKTVKEFQNKESYQISAKKLQQLQSTIKNKQLQLDELKTQLKLNKKILKEKQKYIQQLAENTKQITNPAQDKQIINKLKAKLKEVAIENQGIKKREMQKHHKLVIAERRLVELEQQQQAPIGRNEQLIKQIEDYKQKVQQCAERVERQNLYIVKLNQRLANQHFQQKSPKNSQRKVISKSMDQLPQLNNKKKKLQDIFANMPPIGVSGKIKKY